MPKILIIALLLVSGAALAQKADRAPKTGDQIPKAVLPAGDLQEKVQLNAIDLSLHLLPYGIRREREDRTSFPWDLPKEGEPYDWTTGNAIRK